MIREVGNKEQEIQAEEIIKDVLLAKSEVSLLIKDYNDIFSSFDPRPYSEKSLSNDFLQEVKRSARDKNGVYELRFLVPRIQRNFEHESMIKKRLREHFRKHTAIIQEEIKKTKRKGIYMAIGGVLMLVIAACIAYYLSGTFISTLLLVLFEPAGWFTAWTGLDQIYYTANEKKPDLEFYKKIADAEIKFSSY